MSKEKKEIRFPYIQFRIEYWEIQEHFFSPIQGEASRREIINY